MTFEIVLNKLMKVLHEPLLHFLILGAGLFIIFDFSVPTEHSLNQKIEVNLAIQNSLNQQFERTWKRPPNQAEEKKLIEHYIREEVFYREAIELELDKNDTVIRQRLRQKLEFLYQSQSVALDDELLLHYFTKNSVNYYIPEKRAFSHVFIGENSSQQYISEISNKLNTDTSVAIMREFTDKNILPETLPLSNKVGIAQIFGDNFATKIMQLKHSQWYGPINSYLGQHFVSITDIQKGYLPDLNTVIKRVENDWRYNQEFENKEQQFLQYLKNYNVVIATNEEQ